MRFVGQSRTLTQKRAEGKYESVKGWWRVSPAVVVATGHEAEEEDG